MKLVEHHLYHINTGRSSKLTSSSLEIKINELEFFDFFEPVFDIKIVVLAVVNFIYLIVELVEDYCHILINVKIFINGFKRKNYSNKYL